MLFHSVITNIWRSPGITGACRLPAAPSQDYRDGPQTLAVPSAHRCAAASPLCLVPARHSSRCNHRSYCPHTAAQEIPPEIWRLVGGEARLVAARDDGHRSPRLPQSRVDGAVSALCVCQLCEPAAAPPVGAFNSCGA